MTARQLDVYYLITLGRLLRRVGQALSIGVLTASGQHDGWHAGQGGDFRELRPYQFGDDPRQIDWRVSARKNEPYFRERYQGFARRVHIILDWYPGLFYGTRGGLKVELAIETAVALLWSMVHEQQDAHLTLVTDAAIVDFRISNTASLIRCIEALARRYSEDIQASMTQPQSVRVAWPSLIAQDSIVISDFHNMDATAWQKVATVQQQFHLSCLAIADATEVQALDTPYPYKSGRISGNVARMRRSLFEYIYREAAAASVRLLLINYGMERAMRLNRVLSVIGY